MHYAVLEVPSNPSPPIAPGPTTEEPKKVEPDLPGKEPPRAQLKGTDIYPLYLL